MQYRQEVHELDEGNFVDVHQKVMYLCLLLENVCMYVCMYLNSKRSNTYLMFIWRTYAFSCTHLHVTNWAWTLLLYSSVVDVWPSLFTIDIRYVVVEVRAAHWCNHKMILRFNDQKMIWKIIKMIIKEHIFDTF